MKHIITISLIVIICMGISFVVGSFYAATFDFKTIPIHVREKMIAGFIIPSVAFSFFYFMWQSEQ